MEELTLVCVRLDARQLAIVERLSRAQGDSGRSAAIRRMIDFYDRAERRAVEADDGQMVIRVNGTEYTV